MGKYDAAKESPRSAADARPACIANLSQIKPESYERPQDGMAGVAYDLGEATGAKLLGIDVTDIPPGKKSSHLHTHSLKEEFFYVLEGRCKLKLGDAEYELGPGDAVSRPAGTGVPHQFFNPFDKVCRVMMIGVQGGTGVEDVVEWPELKRAMVMDPGGVRKVVRR